MLALQAPNIPYKFRPVQLTDAQRLASDCWPDRPLSNIHQMVSRAQQNARQGRGLGVIVAGEAPTPIIGYGQLTIWPRTAEISDLVVLESHRGQGIGTGLIQYLARVARDMHAPAIEIGAAYSNPNAIRLYKRLGFEDSHVITLNLGDGMEDVLYLAINLLE